MNTSCEKEVKISENAVPERVTSHQKFKQTMNHDKGKFFVQARLYVDKWHNTNNRETGQHTILQKSSKHKHKQIYTHTHTHTQTGQQSHIKRHHITQIYIGGQKILMSET